MAKTQDEHEFMVTGVEQAAGETTDDIVVRLTDARGGRVRLNLSPEMAGKLRDALSAALDKVPRS
jgi:hypothetical protein